MAARFWIGGGTNSNWNSSPTTNWAATSGGTTRVAAPTSSDDVTFDGAGINGNTNSTLSSGITVLSFTVTSGYTSTITHNANLTVAGNITLNTSYTIAGSSQLAMSANGTITSNGKTWPNDFAVANGITITLSGNFTISGAYKPTVAIATINKTTSEKFFIGNGCTSPVNAKVQGTTTLVFTGGTVLASSGVANNGFAIDIEFQGNVTIGSELKFNGTGKTITYTSGTITTTGSNLILSDTTTLNTNGMSWATITVSGSPTITLSSALSLSTFSFSSGGCTFSGSYGFTCTTFTASSTSAATFTLVNTVTYTITTTFNCFTSRVGSIVLFISDHATNKTILTLQNNTGVTCACLADFTRIDASAGRSITTFNGTITSCLNVVSWNDMTGNSGII